MASKDTVYFAAKEDPKEVVSILVKKTKDWKLETETNGYMEKLRRSWAMYHGVFFSNTGGGDHQISFTGEQGELVQLPVNHYRNIASHLLTMTTSNRPSVNTRATNSDYKSKVQTILANGLLDYYLREKNLEAFLKNGAESAIVFGEGYLKVEWDAMAGEVVDINEETGAEIYEGDLKFSNLSPFDVIRDSSREDQEHDWIMCRTFKNRFDLIAKYPELEEGLLAADSKEERTNNFSSRLRDDTDLIAVWEFYHRRSEALPNGRYVLFVSEDAVMYDGAIPYRNLPIYRIAPSSIMGTPFGYTPMFDLLPLQENLNMLYSIVATNHHTFGVQNILVPAGGAFNVSQLAGGLNVIEYTPGLGKPESLNLTATPAEIFNMIQRLEQDMETLSGINSVARGNPEASLKSGAALALVQAQAVQFASGLQGSYVKLIESVCGSVVKVLQDFAAVPRVAAIAGKSNRSYMKEFTGEDLSLINRVIVEIVNPLSKTTAGRMEIANNLMQMGLIKNTTQYFTVLNTGRLEALIEGDQAELLNITAENEKMLDGEAVVAFELDNHVVHINEHKALIADPDLRKDPVLVQLVLDHCMEHITKLRNTDPDLLMLMGQQPLQPQPAPGAPPPVGPEFQKPAGEEGAANAAPANAVMEELPIGAEQTAGLPEQPVPPPPFEGMPTNPGDVPPEGGSSEGQ
jgi:hypothetical protein